MKKIGCKMGEEKKKFDGSRDQIGKPELVFVLECTPLACSELHIHAVTAFAESMGDEKGEE